MEIPSCTKEGHVRIRYGRYEMERGGLCLCERYRGTAKAVEASHDQRLEYAASAQGLAEDLVA